MAWSAESSGIEEVWVWGFGFRGAGTRGLEEAGGTRRSGRWP